AEGMIVFQTLVRAFNYLIAKYDVDGFRIDTLMYLDPVFARNFANSIREFAQCIGKKNFFTFGEVWGTEEQIAHFIGRNAMAEGEPIGVDAALDYPLFYKLPAVVKGKTAPSELHSMYEYRKQVESGVLSTHGDASNYFRAIQRLSLLRDSQPALRYGRCYFRPISGDDVHFGVSASAPGIVSYSRILSEQEILIVANTNTQSNWVGAVIVDEAINPV